MAVKKREMDPKVVDAKRRSVLHFMSVAQKAQQEGTIKRIPVGSGKPVIQELRVKSTSA